MTRLASAGLTSGYRANNSVMEFAPGSVIGSSDFGPGWTVASCVGAGEDVADVDGLGEGGEVCSVTGFVSLAGCALTQLLGVNMEELAGGYGPADGGVVVLEGFRIALEEVKCPLDYREL